MYVCVFIACIGVCMRAIIKKELAQVAHNRIALDNGAWILHIWHLCTSVCGSVCYAASLC